jgi:hypothetical protein
MHLQEVSNQRRRRARKDCRPQETSATTAIRTTTVMTTFTFPNMDTWYVTLEYRHARASVGFECWKRVASAFAEGWPSHRRGAAGCSSSSFAVTWLLTWLPHYLFWNDLFLLIGQIGMMAPRTEEEHCSVDVGVSWRTCLLPGRDGRQDARTLQGEPDHLLARPSVRPWLHCHRRWRGSGPGGNSLAGGRSFR